MIIIAGEIRMQTNSRHQFMESVAPMVTATLQEQGCQTYAFTPDPNDDNLIRLFEVWDTEEALDGHMNSTHMAEWRERSAGLPVASRDLTLYTVDRSRPLA